MIEEGVDWCGTRILWEEEVLREVSGWERKGSDLESTHHHDSREEPVEEELVVPTIPDIPAEQVTSEK